MGYIRHNAIVATGWQEEAAKALMTYAAEVGSHAAQVDVPTNGYFTVLIAPDGSKEGWQTSDEGDQQRASIRNWLREAYDKGLYFEWCEVVYGNDDGRAEVVTSEWSEPHDRP